MGRVISHTPTQVKPADDAPRSSQQTQPKPSPRPQRPAVPPRRTAVDRQEQPPRKRSFAKTAGLFLGLLLFMAVGGGLFGYGAYRYLDSQHKEGDRESARTPVDLKNPLDKPLAVNVGGTANAATDTPTGPASPPTKVDPKAEAPVAAPAPKPNPPADPPAKTEPPAPVAPPAPKPDVPPPAPPADPPKPPVDPAPKPADNPKPPADPVPPPPDKAEPKPDDRLKPILAALKDKKPAARQQALEELGKLGADGRPAAGAVCEVVAGDTSPAVRQSALDCLDKIHPDFSSKVVVLVVEADALKHMKALQDITGMGDDARPALSVLLAHWRSAPGRFQDDCPTVMSEDLHALASAAPDDPATHKVLIEGCKFAALSRFRQEIGEPVRAAAVAALADVVRKSPEQAKHLAPPLLIAVKSMTDVTERGQAVGVLGTMAENDPDLRARIAAGLLPLVKAADVQAITALAKCGRDAKDAMPALKQLKLNPQEAVRTAAADAINHIEDALASADNPAPKSDPVKPKNPDPAPKPRPAAPAEDADLPADLRGVAARVRSGGADDRVKAAEEFTALGDKAKPASAALCEAALDSNQKVSHAALVALEAVNPDLKNPVFVLLVDAQAANHIDALGKLAALGDDGRPAAVVVRQEIKKCVEQIGNNPPRWGNPTLVQVVDKAMETLPKVAPSDPQTVKTIIELTKFTSASGPILDKSERRLTSTPFREDGARLLGEIAESQEDQRKQVVPPLVSVLKEAVEHIAAAGDQEFAALEGMREVDEAGNALLKCGPDGKDVLVKTVLPKLKELEFNKSAQVRQAAEALKKKIEDAQ